MSSEFRAFLKPKGSNPEINSCYYELVSFEHIDGMSNCEVLNLGFKFGDFAQNIIFRPIDRRKPIVFAINSISDDCHFIVLNEHTPGKPHNRMINAKRFKTDKFIVDCSSRSSGRDSYWSVIAGGDRFVFGRNVPGAYVFPTAEQICEFVGGGLTANQLRAAGYRVELEAQKEVRREDRIRELAEKLYHSECGAQRAYSKVMEDYNRESDARKRFEGELATLRDTLQKLVDRWLPFIGRKRLKQILHPKTR